MIRKHPTRPFLRAWRKRLGKTAEWLANEIGTVHSTVLRYEAGTTGVDDATFEAIAKAYGISIAELSAHPNDAEKARAMDRILRAIRDMDEEGLSVIAGFAERMKPRN
ncbi:helix-turn-helix domain-containing protein [Paracraurococcus ruber]|uniref:HTH cro/C1-type domain-containing protein n=1 Tax=Paracraurococcus ruber TaxID=77675 RepID=A0ABS1CR77_9PROT|nr:helix-turn-helix transcriptional regulator [Paracraurococcus ruber]MBK1656868.1 hypothetical protein [Paracraurococcus ruber]TDG33982.1 XRE family transcriptional regulator [Paracraurococcus ruber]